MSDTFKKFLDINKASDEEISGMFEGETMEDIPASFRLEDEESRMPSSTPIGGELGGAKVPTPAPKEAEEEIKMKDPKALIGAKPKPFFYPQTSSVDMDVKGDMGDLEKTLKSFGETQLPVSSGNRSEESVLEILKDRISRDKLGDYPEAEDLIKEVLLRGRSSDELTYPKGDWRTPAREQLAKKYPNNPNKVEEILNKIGKSRGDFGGYESPHTKGMKVDIPRGFFLDKYGKDKGAERYKKLLEFLKKSGYEYLDEPNAGQKGVLDINLKPKE